MLPERIMLAAASFLCWLVPLKVLAGLLLVLYI